MSQETETLKQLNDKLWNSSEDCGRWYRDEENRLCVTGNEKLEQYHKNLDLLDFTSNDPDEIEGHLSDLKSAIQDTEELLNS